VAEIDRAAKMPSQTTFRLNRTNIGLRDLELVFFEGIFELSPLLATLTHEIAVSPLLATHSKIGWGGGLESTMEYYP
jgi:hypothetical protein